MEVFLYIDYKNFTKILKVKLVTSCLFLNCLFRYIFNFNQKGYNVAHK